MIREYRKGISIKVGCMMSIRQVAVLNSIFTTIIMGIRLLERIKSYIVPVRRHFE